MRHLSSILGKRLSKQTVNVKSCSSPEPCKAYGMRSNMTDFPSARYQCQENASCCCALDYSEHLQGMEDIALIIFPEAQN